jgi:hypothetical protein
MGGIRGYQQAIPIGECGHFYFDNQEVRGSTPLGSTIFSFVFNCLKIAFTGRGVTVTKIVTMVPQAG